MYSKLIGFDTDNCSPDKAIATVMAEVNRLVREEGLSLTAAWARLKSSEPELCAKMLDEQKPAYALNNGSAPQPQTIDLTPANKMLFTTVFKLPSNTEDGLIKSAWVANSGRTDSVNYQRVFLNVQAYLAQTRNWSVEAAKSYMMDNLRDLCKAAGQMPVIQSGGTSY